MKLEHNYNLVLLFDVLVSYTDCVCVVLFCCFLPLSLGTLNFSGQSFKAFVV